MITQHLKEILYYNKDDGIFIWLYMFGYFPEQIGHINGNPLDNRLKNLRNVTHTENQRNRKLDKRSKTGICGVWLVSRAGPAVGWSRGDCFLTLSNNLNYHVNHGRR